MKFRFRILLSVFALLICFYLFYSTWMIGQMTPRYLEITEDNMIESSVSFAEMVGRNSTDAGIDLDFLNKNFNNLKNKNLSAKIYEVEKTKLSFGIYVTDDKGLVIYDSIDSSRVGKNYSQWNDVFLSLKGKYGARTTYNEDAGRFSGVVFVGSPIIKNNIIIGCLTVYKPIQAIAPYLEIFEKNFLMMGIFVLIILGFFFFLILTWVLIPLKRLVDYSRSLTDQLNLAQVKKNDNDEFASIRQNLNVISGELDDKLYVEKYLQVLTHELKGPVSAIKGASEILEENINDAEMQKFCKNINFEIQRIQNLIVKFLDLASLEFRKNEIPMEKLDLQTLLQHAVNAIQSKQNEKNINIKIIGNEEVIIEGNEILLEDAFCNILANALEFSSSGQDIELTFKKEDKRVKIFCRDHGVGIPDYAIDKVFQKFFSLAKPGSNKKGSGLGLAFVKEVIELHQGSISIVNCLDGGVEVIIYLNRYDEQI